MVRAFGEGGGDGEDRIFVDHRGRALAAARRRPSARWRGRGGRRPARRLRSRRFSDGDVGAHLDQRFEQAGAARIDADISSVMSEPGTISAATTGRRRRTGSPGTRDRRGRELGLAGDARCARASAVVRRPSPRRRNGVSMSSVWSRVGSGSITVVIAGRVEPGQQHRRLHLRRGDRQAVGDRHRLVGADDGERQAAAGRALTKLAPMLRQRLDDARHRPALARGWRRR